MTADEAGRLAGFVDAIDPLRPGARTDTDQADDGAALLAASINAMLDRVETERRESGRRRLAIQERERRRLASALHDDIGQLLAAALLQIDHAQQTGVEAPSLTEGRRALEAALAVVQRLSHDLRPLVLDDVGLADALAALAATVRQRLLLDVDRRVSSEGVAMLDTEEQGIVFRVAQEALTSVLHDGSASSARLVLEPADGGLELRVSSDAAGPPDAARIREVRELAVLVGGSVDDRSAEVGSEIVLRLARPNGAPDPL